MKTDDLIKTVGFETQVALLESKGNAKALMLINSEKSTGCEPETGVLLQGQYEKGLLRFPVFFMSFEDGKVLDRFSSVYVKVSLELETSKIKQKSTGSSYYISFTCKIHYAGIQ